MEKLRKYLATLPNGKITDRDQIAKVEELLAEEWPELEGNWTKMAGYKIPGEQKKWNGNPRYCILRLSAMVLQCWAPKKLNYKNGRST